MWSPSCFFEVHPKMHWWVDRGMDGCMGRCVIKQQSKTRMVESSGGYIDTHCKFGFSVRCWRKSSDSASQSTEHDLPPPSSCTHLLPLSLLAHSAPATKASLLVLPGSVLLSPASGPLHLPLWKVPPSPSPTTTTHFCTYPSLPHL